MDRTEMAELLDRQINLIRQAIADLERIRGELPTYRHAELASVVGRLEGALADDRKCSNNSGKSMPTRGIDTHASDLREAIVTMFTRQTEKITHAVAHLESLRDGVSPECRAGLERVILRLQSALDEDAKALGRLRGDKGLGEASD